MNKLLELINRKKKAKGPLFIGVSGIFFSEHEQVATEMTNVLKEDGYSVIHHHVPVSYNLSVEALNDKNTGKYIYEHSLKNKMEDIAAFKEKEVDIVVVDGLFILKNLYRDMYDLTVWIDCTYETGFSRADECNVVMDKDSWKIAKDIQYSIDAPKEQADMIIVRDECIERGPQIILHETFNDSLNPQLNWLHEPSVWSVKNGSLYVKTDPITDFWQRTHYGFQNDNGHFLYVNTDRDFVMTTKVRFNPKHQFDQAGLMIRIDEENWIKTSMEYELDNPAKLGAVVTNLGYSDWSTQPIQSNVTELTFRITRTGKDYVIHALVESEWIQLRVAHLHDDAKEVMCGFYCCSPIKDGYEVHVDELIIKELLV
ncbi:DUF1349 domain-containing protein [Priestia iocasae]|uniref:Regulation of enolase protein 1 (Concanavalin A-like superfamily)/uridine kinase n=1 Tax=Priestia iocasae TaxID=2291674 RepID=A0ABS2QVQ1_9BACI|nr:DUF1349 domain-containing protein [Metabacillus iocasae]MBM7703072.1 regulation of enolase protein 1 (concanavalin A-like superfamily)/uridine kinase [Metabacillus iocasae]